MNHSYLVAFFLGAILVTVPIATSASTFSYTMNGFGKSVNAVNDSPNTRFIGNATFVHNGTAVFNFLGMGGNDTFDLFGGNATDIFVASGAKNNTFNVVTGNPPAFANASSTFSMVSGGNSTFNIIQNNHNGSITIVITGGPHCLVNDTSIGPVANTFFSISVGRNSTVSLGSQFAGNETSVNIVF
jgi:hypothetical protein